MCRGRFELPLCSAGRVAGCAMRVALCFLPGMRQSKGWREEIFEAGF